MEQNLDLTNPRFNERISSVLGSSLNQGSTVKPNKSDSFTSPPVHWILCCFLLQPSTTQINELLFTGLPSVKTNRPRIEGACDRYCAMHQLLSSYIFKHLEVSEFNKLITSEFFEITNTKHFCSIKQ